MENTENPHVAYFNSPIGLMEIKCSADTIISAEFIPDLSEFPPLTENRTLEICIIQLKEYFEGTRRTFDIQVDQPGTDFQQLIWKQLESIPYGKTISYRELAFRTGNPKNIRAAGTANGKNKIAVIVPCHRVVGNNGEMTGYAWDLWRKQWLLEHEGRIANGVQTLF